MGSSSSRRKLSKRRYNWRAILIICAAILCLGALVFGVTRMIANHQQIAKIKVQLKDLVILQDEEMPVVELTTTYEKDNKAVQDFLAKISEEGCYQIQTKADLSKEGTYEVSIVWSEEITDKLESEWKKRIKVDIEPGILTVKNKFGEWEDNKFKKIDGTYAANEFITSNDKEYYFDAEGNKVTGEYKINGYTYYFSEEGVFEVEKNKLHPAKPMVALTFDDGPGRYTEDLLTVLEEYDSRATFFVLGQQVESFPTSIKKMKELGCEIGNHTYSHARLTELSEKDMKSQINKTNDAIKAVIGEGTKLVRPTYGDVNSAVREHVKYPLIMWSLDTEDWKLKDSAKIADVILSQVEDGDIILMHDIHEFTLEAMKTVIPELVSRGYQLVTVSELASTHGVAMKNTEKYFEF